MKHLQTITAICAAVSGLFLGAMLLVRLVNTGDLVNVPFMIIGFVGSAVMWANRK